MQTKTYLQIGLLLASFAFSLLFPQTTLAASKIKPKTNITHKSTKKFLPNGDLSANLEINEVFPNPKGPDSGKEWLELYNSSDKPVNLGNWVIRQKNLQNPSAKAKISKLSNNLTIKGKSYLILNNTILKTTLNNQDNTIELLDFQGKTISTTSYQTSQEGSSLSKITAKDWDNPQQSQTTYLWTNPTPNTENPKFYKIQGQIQEENFEKNLQNNKITITTAKNEEIPITLNKNAQTALLKPNLKILALVEKNTDTYLLYNYKVLPQAKNQDSRTKTIDNWLSTLFRIIFLVIILSTIIYSLIKAKSPLTRRNAKNM